MRIHFLKDRRGVVVIMVFLIMITLIAIMGAFLYMTSVQTKAVGNDSSDAKALWIAQGGIQQVFYKLKNDSSYTNNPTQLTGNLGDGSYSVTVTKDGINYSINSVGTVGSASRTITQTVTAALLPEAYQYAAYVGGSILTTNSTGLIIESQKTGGANFPTVDFASYYAATPVGQRVANGYTFTGTKTGLWYVSGSAMINGGSTINGTIIAEGAIATGGTRNKIIISPPANYPALVSKKNIDFNSVKNSTINGLVYAGAGTVAYNINLASSQGLTITGTIISKASLSVSNTKNLHIYYDSNIANNPPLYISGGGATGQVVPQKDWNEAIPVS